jgi:cobalt transporter subunit CbtA
MTRQIFASALFAGVAAGALAFLLQYVFINPLIIEGELYETGVRAHFAASLDAPVQSPAGLDVETERDLGRDIQSFGFALITYTAFALVLVGTMMLADRFGRSVTPRQGIVWGLAAFAAIQLAPAFGLPPELPGTVGAEIGQRQGWWLFCAGMTGLGLGLIAFGPGLVLPILGIAAIAAPHLVGAPHLDTYFGVAPPELSARFATASLAVSAASWTILGLLASTFMNRFREN